MPPASGTNTTASTTRKERSMKAFTGLFTLLLAIQVLPWAVASVHAQTADARTVQFEDQSDGRKLQLDYGAAYISGAIVELQLPSIRLVLELDGPGIGGLRMDGRYGPRQDLDCQQQGEQAGESFH